MIPKVIHYCWFGKNPLSELALKCIASWKKFFPDYEIKEWNENNFDLDCCDYVREAYAAKKWAFVSDYARFWILYTYGGLYFDTDVEVINDMSDIIEKGAFMGCEISDNSVCGIGVNPGLGLGTKPGLSLYKEILDSYNGGHFFNNNGTCNYTTIVERTTNILEQHGFVNINVIQEVADIFIYPKEYFCPMDYTTGKLQITDKSRTIHWYDASWFDERMKVRRRRSEIICNKFHGNIGKFLSKIYMSGSYYWEWISTGDFKTIKQKIAEKFQGRHQND